MTTKTMRWTLVLSTLVVIAAAAPNVASACSCSTFDVFMVPEPDATEVPINTKIWLLGIDATVLDPEGNEVAVMRSTIDTLDGPLNILDPGELDPEATYQIITNPGPEVELSSSFVTGTQRDDEPPMLPEETDREHHRRSGGICPRSRWVDLSVEFEGILLADVGERATESGMRSGSASVTTIDHRLSLGKGGCNRGLDGDSTIRYAAFDMAGNFSGWTEATDISSRGGCSIGTKNPPLWMVGSLLFAVFATRRPRRSSGTSSVKRPRGSRLPPGFRP